LLKCLTSNFLLVLATLQGFRQLCHLLLEIKIRGLSEGEVALKFLRFLRKLLVHFLLINEPFSGNLPKHGRFKSIILLKLRELGWRIRTKKILKL
jgi:hypothetical protein